MKRIILFISLFFLTTLIWAGSFQISGYIPSYRLESAERAVGSSVLDLSRFNPGFSAPRRIHQNNLEFTPSSFPEKYRYSSIESWYGENVDRLIYFSVSPGENGTLDTSSIDERDLSRLKNIHHLHNTEIILAVNGNSERFIPVIDQDETRQRFIDELVSFCSTNGFHGIDYDWEYPKGDDQLALFNQLVSDSVEIFSEQGMTVSAAVSRFKPLSGDALSKLDRINLMAYDNYGRHSTYESAVEASEYLQIKYNIQPEKIYLGIPFYGRIYSGLDPQYWTRTKIYRDLTEDFSLQPSQDEAGGFYFNGMDTVRKKTAYALEKGFGGVMIWELGQDRMGEQSLLEAIREEIH